MALRAGYVGIKGRLMKQLSDKLSKLDGIIPAEASSDNPLATVQDVNTSVTLLDDTVGFLGKNKLINNASSASSSGVTRTVNENRSISLGGTAEESVTGTINTYTGAQLKAMGNKLILSGGVSSVLYLTLRLVPWSIVYADFGNGVLIDTSTLDDDVTYYLSYAINQGVNTDGEVLYPMLSDPEVYALSPSYVPYHESVEDVLDELTDSAADQKTAINAIITAATGAADFAAFKTAMEAITPVTRSIQAAPEEDPEPETRTTKSTKSSKK